MIHDEVEKFNFANAERNCSTRLCSFDNKISLVTFKLSGLSLACYMEMDLDQNGG